MIGVWEACHVCGRKQGGASAVRRGNETLLADRRRVRLRFRARARIRAALARLPFRPAGLPRYPAGLPQSLPRPEKTTEDVLADADKVVDRVTVRCTHTGEFRGHPPTGKAVTMTEMHIARVEGGRIVERWGEWDLLGLLEQIGVASVAAAPEPA
jgi:hypothetical protein